MLVQQITCERNVRLLKIIANKHTLLFNLEKTIPFLVFKIYLLHVAMFLAKVVRFPSKILIF